MELLSQASVSLASHPIAFPAHGDNRTQPQMKQTPNSPQRITHPPWENSLWEGVTHHSCPHLLFVQESLPGGSRATAISATMPCDFSGWPSLSYSDPHRDKSLCLSSFIQEAIGILQRACVMGKYKRENMRAEIPSASQRRNFLTNIT